MSIPDTWMQTYVYLPPTDPSSFNPDYSQCWAQWWTFSLPLPSGFSMYVFHQEFVDQIRRTWGKNIHGFGYTGTFIFLRSYLKLAGVLSGPYEWFFPGSQWAYGIGPGAPGPGVLQYGFRFFNHSHPEVFIRKFIGPVRRDTIRGDFIARASTVDMEVFADQLIVPQTFGGLVVRAVARSRKLDELLTYDSYHAVRTVEGLLAYRCKRRGKHRPNLYPPTFPMT